MYKYEHPLYLCWRSMKSRCHSPSSSSFDRYGGRGISVCSRWLLSFDEFCFDMGKRPSGYSIDRIDHDGNYEPSNCRWASFEEQANNKSTTIKLIRGGITKCLTEWSKEIGVDPYTMRARKHRGESDEEILRPLGMSVASFRLLHDTGEVRYRGISYRGEAAWMVRIYKNGRRVCLGTFKSKHEAARVYNTASRMYGGPKAFMNKIKQGE